MNANLTIDAKKNIFSVDGTIMDNLRQLHSTHPDVGLIAAAQGA